MTEAGSRRTTLGAAKVYDTANFVLECREANVTPAVAQNITTMRGSRTDAKHAALRLRGPPSRPQADREALSGTKKVAGLA